jgi:hypothetical protein
VLEFVWVKAHRHWWTDEPLVSEIDTLLPMALWGWNSLYLSRQSAILSVRRHG